MSGIFGGASQSTQPVVYTGVQVQTSSQGLPVPVVYGTTRVADNLLWYGGFRSTQSSSGKGGALANVIGKGTGQNTYSADVILGVAEGPIQGFGQAWASKTPTTLSALGFTTFLGTYPQSQWSYVSTAYPSQARPYTGLAYLGATAYALGASAELPNHTFEVYGIFSNRVVYAPGTIPGSGPYSITVGSVTWADGSVHSLWVSDVGVAGYTSTGGAPAAGQYHAAAGVYTFNVADSGKAVVIAFNGIGQDADPSLVVADMLSNPNYGVGFPAGMVGELTAYAEDMTIPGSPYQLTVANAAGFDDNLSVYHIAGLTLFTCVTGSPGPLQYSFANGIYTFNTGDVGKTVEVAYSALAGLVGFQNYCWALGFFVSPDYNQQAAAAGLLDEIAQYCNSEIVWSSGALKLVPRGDLTLSGNGHTYTAPSATQWDLTDDYFQESGSGGGGSGGSNSNDPVLLTRKRVSDSANVVQVEIKSRTNQYNSAVVDATDQAAVDAYGRRPTGKMSTDLFKDQIAARLSAQLILQHEQIRNGYAFQLDSRFCWLDPMDIVSLLDVALGLDTSTWVRIMQVAENEDGSGAYTTEEYATGVSNAQSYESQIGAGYAANYATDPGPVNTPLIFEPSTQLATNTGLEIWCAVSGADSDWGGCDVYVSSDDVTYAFAGRKYGPSRTGALTGPLADHADPDNANTASVDLTESFGQLVSGTTADAALGNTACIIDGELFSFVTANLTSTYHYDLSTLRRGQFGTAHAAHLTGAQFARLDDTIFKLPYDKSQIGQTIYTKFVSFNHWGGGQEDISTVTAYPHMIVGPPPPGIVQDFAVIQQGGPVIFSWSDLPDFVLKGYDILYGDVSGTVDTANYLTTASRATEMTHANVPPGTWQFYIRGHDLADQVGPASTFTFTVKNYNFEIIAFDGEPDWFGTLTNGVRHPSGVVVPQDQNLSNTYGWEAFNDFVPTPYPSPEYDTPEIDTGADGDARVVLSESVLAATAYGETGMPFHTGQLRYRTSSGSYGAFQDWISGTITGRYVEARFILDTSVQGYVNVFDVLVDSPPVTETMTSTIDIAGTSIVWQEPFRSPPVVNVTPGAAGATSGSAENITTTGALIRLWNGAAEVSGTANIAATGV